jgi:hypothetical protein
MIEHEEVNKRPSGDHGWLIDVLTYMPASASAPRFHLATTTIRWGIERDDDGVYYNAEIVNIQLHRR